MKKLIIIFTVIVGLQSCGPTVNQIARNCDKYLMVCGTETERVIEYRDTTLYVEKEIEVPVPHFKDSLRIRDSVNVITVVNPVTKKETHRAQMDTTTHFFGMIGVQAWVKDSQIGIDAWLTDSTFLYNYQDSIKVNNGIKDIKEKVTVPVKYIPGFYKFTFWFFITFVVVAGIIVLSTVVSVKSFIKGIFE